MIPHSSLPFPCLGHQIRRFAWSRPEVHSHKTAGSTIETPTELISSTELNSTERLRLPGDCQGGSEIQAIETNPGDSRDTAYVVD